MGLAMDRILHLGDLALAAPLALAIGAWLAAMRGPRAATAWMLLFGSAVLLVGANKIAYLGWGQGLPAIGFKALSGHATLAMAVYPLLAHVLAARHWPLAASGGALLGVAIAFVLVLQGEHTMAEALAGCLLGAAVAAGGIALAGPAPAALPLPALACTALLLAGSAALAGNAPVGYWMIKAARILSGHARPCPLANSEWE